MRKQYELNAPAIKKGLTNFGIKVLSCYKGKGTSKKATYIRVSSENLDKTFSVFNELGIVNSLGKEHTKCSCSGDYYDFGACYMSKEMFEELNN